MRYVLTILLILVLLTACAPLGGQQTEKKPKPNRKQTIWVGTPTTCVLTNLNVLTPVCMG